MALGLRGLSGLVEDMLIDKRGVKGRRRRGDRNRRLDKRRRVGVLNKVEL